MHVILRGIDRRAIFFADNDYRHFLTKLTEVGGDRSVRVHAYVLMTNHVHLLATAASGDGVSALMKGLGQRYVQYVNRTYHRTGTLFEGRLCCSLVETDTYLLACQRYIELNPVRAGMVDAPADYCWSSYRANALGAEDPAASPHSLYAMLGRRTWKGSPGRPRKPTPDDGQVEMTG